MSSSHTYPMDTIGEITTPRPDSSYDEWSPVMAGVEIDDAQQPQIEDIEKNLNMLGSTPRLDGVSNTIFAV